MNAFQGEAHPNDKVPQGTQMSEAFTRDDHQVSLIDLITWLGRGKRWIAGSTILAAVVSLAISFTLTPVYTARTTLLPPGTQTQNSAAVLASLSSIGGLDLNIKSPDELYVALLKSDGVTRALDERFGLKAHYTLPTNEALRKALPLYVRVSSDKKSGVIGVEVDDEDPRFAAELANAHTEEVNKVLARLTTNEAQQRVAFFDRQLKATKENLAKAEFELQHTQERTGIVMLDAQTEALITSAARVRASIADLGVQLQVVRAGSTDRNPDAIRLLTQLNALRSELARMESAPGAVRGRGIDLPVDKIPGAAVDYMRARRDLALQESLLGSITKQFELAKLDEAREGAPVQLIDKAVPPDWKSKPSRASLVLACTFLAFVGSIAWVLARPAMARERDSARGAAWQGMKKAWRFRT